MNQNSESGATRRVRELKIKTLARDRAKLVKGGPCPGTNTRPARSGSF